MNYSELLLKVQKLGYRKTKVLEAVLQEFSGQHTMLSASELLEKVAANKTTVYRLLEKLVKSNILLEVRHLSDSTLYELNVHHHHHFKCNGCDKIKEIHDTKLEQAIHDFESKLITLGYKPEKHHFNLQGTCENC